MTSNSFSFIALLKCLLDFYEYVYMCHLLQWKGTWRVDIFVIPFKLREITTYNKERASRGDCNSPDSLHWNHGTMFSIRCLRRGGGKTQGIQGTFKREQGSFKITLRQWGNPSGWDARLRYTQWQTTLGCVRCTLGHCEADLLSQCQGLQRFRILLSRCQWDSRYHGLNGREEISVD